MNNHPKVSIVIPVYNGENYMKEAIDSALNQTYDNIEVIVVNDGSTDNTEEIALSYGERVRYYSKENGGVASALNLGIQKMEGEYFSWLSHDDIYLENKIEEQLRRLNQEEDKTKIVYGRWLQKDMSNLKIQKIAPEYRLSVEQLQNSIFPVLFGQVNGCAMLIHKSHFARVGLFDEKLITSQDYDMWYRLMRNQKTIYMEKPLVIQRIHNGQGSRTIDEFIDNCESLQLHMSAALEENEINIIFGGKAKFYYDMFAFSKENGWRRCEQYYFQKYLEEDDEQRPFDLRLKKKQRLILYCAGKNGRKVKKELEIRNIDVTFFCDSSSELWGRDIDGVKCISPEDLRCDDFIIVTKDYPEKLVEELNSKGVTDVIGYSEIAKELFSSLPDRNKVRKLYEV